MEAIYRKIQIDQSVQQVACTVCSLLHVCSSQGLWNKSRNFGFSVGRLQSQNSSCRTIDQGNVRISNKHRMSITLKALYAGCSVTFLRNTSGTVNSRRWDSEWTSKKGLGFSFTDVPCHLQSFEIPQQHSCFWGASYGLSIKLKAGL